jgi:chromosome segregation ATPase
VAPTPAREETFYLLRDKSVEIDSGLIGLAPGTAVVKVSDKGETMLVRYGEHQFEVDKKELTASRGTAKKASQADTIAQDKIGGTYHVPLAVVPELSSERKAIEELQAKAGKLEADLIAAKQSMDEARARAEDSQSQVNRSADDIGRAKTYLDRASKASVDNYNGLVAQYNRNRAAQQSLNQAAIEQINRFNALLTQFKAQSATINQMAAVYNAKVKHYGK